MVVHAEDRRPVGLHFMRELTGVHVEDHEAPVLLAGDDYWTFSVFWGVEAVVAVVSQRAAPLEESACSNWLRARIPEPHEGVMCTDK